MTKHRKPREPGASEDDGGAHAQGDLDRAIHELFGALDRQLPKLDKKDGSAIRQIYQIDRHHELDPALQDASAEELELACRKAKRRLNKLLELDLNHRLSMAEGERAKDLRLALEVVHGNVLIELLESEDSEVGPYPN